MHNFFLPVIAQGLFWGMTWQRLIPSLIIVLGSVVVSFVVILLVTSYFRFQDIVEQADEMDPRDMGSSASEVMRVQIARYLAGCARRNTSFSLSLIRPGTPGLLVRMDSDFVAAIKKSVRHDDIVCVCDDETAVLFTEAEAEDSVNILERVIGAVASQCEEISGERIRVGISSYPGHGLSGKELLRVAEQGLKEATAEQRVVLPEIVDVDAEDEESEDQLAEEAVDVEEISEELDDESEEQKPHSKEKGRRSKQKKSALLDPVTGVLKDSAISAHMQRCLSDLRYKKKRAALFCIGVNNMDQVARVHGNNVADDILAGVSRIFQDNLRADDLIGRHEQNAFLVLSECSLAEAEAIGKRISLLVQQTPIMSGHRRLRASITLGVSTYPEHGRNLHQLYKSGQKVLDYSRENDIRAYAVYDPEIHDRVAPKPLKSIKATKV